MKKTRKPAKPITAEAIARMADQGRDVSEFFRDQGRMVQFVNADLAAAMSEELDRGSGGSQHQPAAKAIIEKADHMQLSKRDSLRVLDLLEHPPGPNARLVAAARKLPKRS